jgi:hypothetical protein
MSDWDVRPALEYASLSHHLHRLQLRHDGAKVPAGGVAAFNTDLSAAAVAVALAPSADMPYALGCAH